jgi:hypothetical protein
MIESNVALDGDDYRVTGTFARQRAAGKVGRTLLDALIDGRMT